MSALDALTAEERAELHETLEYRHLWREMTRYGLEHLLLTELERPVAIPSPAAGSEMNFVVPSGSTLEIVTLNIRFVTSATVASRFPQLRLKDQDGSILWGLGSQFPQAASLTWQYVFANGITTLVASGFSLPQFSLPRKPIQAGWSLTTATGSLDSGDAYGPIVCTARDWSLKRVVAAARNILTDLDSAGGIH